MYVRHCGKEKEAREAGEVSAENKTGREEFFRGMEDYEHAFSRLSTVKSRVFRCPLYIGMLQIQVLFFRAASRKLLLNAVICFKMHF